VLAVAGLRSWVLALGVLGTTLGCGVDSGVDAGSTDAGATIDVADMGPDVMYDLDVVFNRDVMALEVHTEDVVPNPDAFFAMDPPPMTCGPDGAVETDATVPGGTPDCPDDKNREGCPCPLTMVGMTAPCWPGLRVNRDRGVCHDGMTTCMEGDEFYGRWGACTGYRLPTPGATIGPDACMCFSTGTWAIADLEACFVSYTNGAYYAFSSTPHSTGHPTCENVTGSPPPPTPSGNWSSTTLTVDCVGEWRLCYTLKAGDVMHPHSTDCTLAHVCTSAYYSHAGRAQTFPALPAWRSTNTACSRSFFRSGGYGEMSVVGTTGDCQHIGASSGGPYVFNRVGYCPPNAPSSMCMSGGSGMF
jgi:hypothetical protein